MLLRSDATMWPLNAVCLACAGQVPDFLLVQLVAGHLLCNQLSEVHCLCSTVLVCLDLRRAAVPHGLCLGCPRPAGNAARLMRRPGGQ